MERGRAEFALFVIRGHGGDKEAASIVTDGCNMGIKTICGYKNQYSGASKAVMEIADELTGMEENLRDCMKKFL